MYVAGTFRYNVKIKLASHARVAASDSLLLDLYLVLLFPTPHLFLRSCHEHSTHRYHLLPLNSSGGCHGISSREESVLLVLRTKGV